MERGQLATHAPGRRDGFDGAGRRSHDAAVRLAVADEHLEAVLETVDLDRNKELAEAVLTALSATDRAYRLEMGRSAGRGRRIVRR